MVKTVTLTAGTPQAVTFSEAYPFYWIDNKTSSEVFASVGGTPEPGKDGTYNIAAGSQLRISGGDFNGGIVLLGEGKVQVIASGIAACPFKSAPVSGGGEIVNNESSYTLTNAADYPIIGLNMYGKSTQDGVPTPDAPVDIVSVGDSGGVEVKSCGKNLLNYDAWKTVDIYNGTAIFENNGITITATKDDAYTQFLYSHFPKLARVFVIEGETITLSWEESTNTSGLVYIFPNGKLDGYVNCNNSLQKKLTYTVPSGVSFIVFRFGVSLAGDTISYKNIMIERGSEATEFEPYKGSTATITSALPLCGIPVDSGGNYTDNNGQQWMCDELIYNADGSGKIVKRTAKIDSYNGEAIATPFISTTGSMTTGATVIYQLAEPQEIELTATEMAALRQLQTYSGVTNIFNSGGANMDVKFCTNKMLSEYVAPITTGLQAQIDELKAAVLSLGGNV